MVAGLYLGATQIKNVYVGNTKAKKVYLGSEQIWSAAVTVTASVASTADDGWTYSSTLIHPNNYGIMLAGSDNSDRGFARFASVAVPAGATIDSASMTVTVSGRGGSLIDCELGAIANGDPPQPQVATDIYGAPLTTASVSWQNLTATSPATSPSLAAIIQEIVNRSDWQSGNAITLVSGFGTTHSAGSFDVAETSETLTITYS